MVGAAAAAGAVGAAGAAAARSMRASPAGEVGDGGRLVRGGLIGGGLGAAGWVVEGWAVAGRRRRQRPRGGEGVSCCLPRGKDVSGAAPERFGGLYGRLVGLVGFVLVLGRSGLN